MPKPAPTNGHRKPAPNQEKLVLAALRSGHPLTVAEIAKSTGVARSSVAAYLSVLVRHGRARRLDRGLYAAVEDAKAEAVDALSKAEAITLLGEAIARAKASGISAEEIKTLLDILA